MIKLLGKYIPGENHKLGTGGTFGDALLDSLFNEVCEPEFDFNEDLVALFSVLA